MVFLICCSVTNHPDVLRSAGTGLLAVFLPRVKKKKKKEEAFGFYAPHIWNKLSPTLSSSKSGL